MRVAAQRLGDRADRVRARVDELAAPAFCAATAPAPNVIPPWVSVGPSSTTSTRLPASGGPSASDTGEVARTIVASGLAAMTSLVSLCDLLGRGAVDLVDHDDVGQRRLVSPGW